MNAQEECAALARDSYLFSALDDAQRNAMLDTLQVVRLREGEALFEHGQPAQRFYLLCSGQVKLFRLSEEGDEKVVEIIKPGQSFAEAVMFMQGKAYPVNASALSASTLAAFPSKIYRAQLEQSSAACLRLMASMSQRLHRHLNEIDSLTLHNATYRLVGYLLEQLADTEQEQPDIMLTTPKHVIASRLSIKPETFSRILLRLAKQGLLQVEGAHIRVTDLDGLRRSAEL